MTNRISIGLGLNEFTFSSARAYWRWIDLCENSTLDSIWQTDRLLGNEPWLETLSTCAVLAGRTRRLKFGMNVVCLGQREPVLVAKQCATIDMLSEGRLLPAFAVGSDRGTEWEMMGIDRKTRGARTNEALEIIHQLWTQDSVDFEGKYYRLRGATLSPKPAQTNLPLWIGGESEAAIHRTARYGTGWIGGTEPPSTAGPIVAAIKAALPGYGRTIDEDHYGAGFPYRFGKPSDDCFELQRGLKGYAVSRKRDPLQYYAVGDADSIVQRITEYVRVGVWKFVLRPTGRDDEDMMLQTRRLIDEVLPVVAKHWPKPANKAAMIDESLQPQSVCQSRHR